MADLFTLDVYQGDDLELTVLVADEADVPIDVTGDTFAAQVRARTSDSQVLLELTCTVTDGPAGEVSVTATGAETAGLPAGRLAWDLEWTSGGTVRTLLAGPVVVAAEVTR